MTKNALCIIIGTEGIAYSGKAVRSFPGDGIVEMEIMELLTLLIAVIEIIKLNNKKITARVPNRAAVSIKLICFEENR